MERIDLTYCIEAKNEYTKLDSQCYCYKHHITFCVGFIPYHVTFCRHWMNYCISNKFNSFERFVRNLIGIVTHDYKINYNPVDSERVLRLNYNCYRGGDLSVRKIKEFPECINLIEPVFVHSNFIVYNMIKPIDILKIINNVNMPDVDFLNHINFRIGYELHDYRGIRKLHNYREWAVELFIKKMKKITSVKLGSVSTNITDIAISILSLTNNINEHETSK